MTFTSDYTSIQIKRTMHKRLREFAKAHGIATAVALDYAVGSMLDHCQPGNDQEFKRLIYERAISALQHKLGYKP